MSTEETVRTIAGYVSDELADEPGEIEPDTPLFAGGYVDSMNLVRLLGFLESTFDVRVPVSEVNDTNFATAVTIARLVERLRGVQQIADSG